MSKYKVISQDRTYFCDEIYLPSQKEILFNADILLVKATLNGNSPEDVYIKGNYIIEVLK